MYTKLDSEEGLCLPEKSFLSITKLWSRSVNSILRQSVPARPVKYWAMCMFMLARNRLRPAIVHALNARITLKVRIAAMDTPLQRVLSLIR